jgi:hypothetical protein
MTIKGTKHVWAVRIGGLYDSVEIFANKPTKHFYPFLTEWRDDTKGASYHGYSIFSFCPKEFNKIARLPLNRPVKITLKITLK